MSYFPVINECKCPVCGETFIPAPEHIYKIKVKYKIRLVCSYACMRKYERKTEEVKKMIKFDNTEVFNFEGAFRGMRNPLNSWDKSDSITLCGWRDTPEFVIGRDDLALAQKLIKAGADHRKFLRQIFVSVDITSWATWWAEFDTYKVATVRNSCSKMHRIHVKEFERSDFSLEGTDEIIKTDRINGGMVDTYVENTITLLELLRFKFNDTHDKKYWRALIELLPHSYNMRATVTLNYETLRNIYGSRRNHKLDEWSVGFMEWIDSLPYAEELIKYGG